jgi:hypothetical protein
MTRENCFDEKRPEEVFRDWKRNHDALLVHWGFANRSVGSIGESEIKSVGAVGWIFAEGSWTWWRKKHFGSKPWPFGRYGLHVKTVPASYGDVHVLRCHHRVCRTTNSLCVSTFIASSRRSAADNRHLRRGFNFVSELFFSPSNAQSDFPVALCHRSLSSWWLFNANCRVSRGLFSEHRHDSSHSWEMFAIFFPSHLTREGSLTWLPRRTLRLLAELLAPI